MFEMIEIWSEIEEKCKEVNGYVLMPVLCMFIDMVAVKNGMKSIELIESILPTIREVNETLGTMELS